MDKFGFNVALIGGMIICLAISFSTFVDYVGIIIKIFHIKAPRDYGSYKELYNSVQYKKHKRKWRKIFALSSIVYCVVYCVTTILIKSILIGLYVAMIAFVFCFGIAGNLEQKELNKIISERKQNNTDDV